FSFSRATFMCPPSNATRLRISPSDRVFGQTPPPPHPPSATPRPPLPLLKVAPGPRREAAWRTAAISNASLCRPPRRDGRTQERLGESGAALRDRRAIQTLARAPS